MNRRTWRALKLSMVSLVLMFAYTNCHQVTKTAVESDNADSSSQVSDLNAPEESQSLGDNTQTASIGEVSQCQFVTAPTVRSLLQQQLGLSGGDVAQLDTEGRVMYYYMERYSGTLGEGNMDEMQAQVRDDHDCSSLKFKVSMMVFLEACAVAMEDPQVVNRIYPDGIDNFETLYLAFTGRMPTNAEVNRLHELQNTVSAEVAPAASCAAVLTTVEVLDRS